MLWNRWSNGTIFYNPSILKQRGPSKKCLSLKEIIVPNHFGLKEEMSWIMDFQSMFSNSKFISYEDLNYKYGIKINALSYLSLKKTLESNLVTSEGNKLSPSIIHKDNHWVNTLTDLFQNTSKGSNTFIKVFNNKSKVEINYNRERWTKLLKTNLICESEILAGYRNMQTNSSPSNCLTLKLDYCWGRPSFEKP